MNKSLLYANGSRYIVRNGDEWRMIDGELPEGWEDQHVADGPRYGLPMLKDSMSTAAALDLDDHERLMEWDDMLDIAGQISDALLEVGLVSHPWRSGSGHGIHLWFIWEKPQDAHSIREYIKLTLDKIGFSIGAAGLIQSDVELYPKQSSGKGSCIALPGGANSVPIDVFTWEDCEELDWEYSDNVPVVEKREISVGSDKPTFKELKQAVGMIPPIEDYEDWIKVLAAIHWCCDGSDEGLELAELWSSKAANYEPGDAGGKWGTFGHYDGDRATWGSLLRRAEESTGMAVVSEDAFPGKVDGIEYRRYTGGQKIGKVVGTIGQVSDCIALDPDFPWKVAHDDFFGEIFVVNGKTDLLNDNHYTEMRRWFEENNWEPIPKEMVRDAVRYAANLNRADSLISWVDSLVWDGVSRINGLLDGMGLSRNKYHTAMIKYMLTGLIGRAYEPGCQLDIVPILIGDQGARKTSFVDALTPKILGFITHGEVTMGELIDRDMAARAVRGKSILLLDELRGMKREREQIKAAITRRIEEHTPKYMENRVRYHRRCLLIGTTNEDEFLDDPTGARRYGPMEIEGQIDCEWIEANQEQLWAEAKEMYLKDGIKWKDAERLARTVHQNHSISDPWEELVIEYIEDAEEISASDILLFKMGISVEKQTKGDQMRIGGILKSMGLIRTRKVVDGVQTRVWVK